MSITAYFSSRREEIIAAFGQALLVKLPEGQWELRGGTPSDRTAAKEWISLFCHEAIFNKGSSSLCKHS